MDIGWVIVAGIVGGASIVAAVWGVVDMVRFPEFRRDKVTLGITLVLSLNAALCVRVILGAL